MYFEDDFKLSQDEVNGIVKTAFVYQVEVFNREGKTSFLSLKLVEAGLKRLGIFSFDFYNDTSIISIQNAFLAAMDFMVLKGAIKPVENTKNSFFKFFTKKHLFSLKEFSQEFEADMVLTMLYKLDFNYKYEIGAGYEQFYKNFVTNEIIETGKKIVDVKLNAKTVVKILPLQKYVPKTSVKNAMKEYDYSQLCDYIAFYNKSQDTISLLPTTAKQDLGENVEKPYLYDKLDSLTVSVNVEGKLKRELILY